MRTLQLVDASADVVTWTCIGD